MPKSMHTFPLIAVDIGNARIKVGFFEQPDSVEAARSLPEPRCVLPLSGESPELDKLPGWIGRQVQAISVASDDPLSWWIGSVNRPAATRLIDWLHDNRPDDTVTLLASADLPLEVGLDRADMVGIDRLIDAVAANRLRDPRRPAVVVDVGTAITVDLISARGVFMGGAIMPGIAMAAKALDEFTDMLPLIDMSELSAPPPAVGTSTVPAMKSGLFWGAVGAIRQLVERMSEGSPQSAQVIITGGAGPAVTQLLGTSAMHVPQLTLAGIAVSAWSRSE